MLPRPGRLLRLRRPSCGGSSSDRLTCVADTAAALHLRIYWSNGSDSGADEPAVATWGNGAGRSAAGVVAGVVPAVEATAAGGMGSGLAGAAAVVAATGPPIGAEPAGASGSGARPVVSGSGVENDRMGTLAGRVQGKTTQHPQPGKGTREFLCYGRRRAKWSVPGEPRPRPERAQSAGDTHRPCPRRPSRRRRRADRRWARSFSGVIALRFARKREKRKVGGENRQHREHSKTCWSLYAGAENEVIY